MLVSVKFKGLLLIMLYQVFLLTSLILSLRRDLFVRVGCSIPTHDQAIDWMFFEESHLTTLRTIKIFGEISNKVGILYNIAFSSGGIKLIVECQSLFSIFALIAPLRVIRKFSLNFL